ncbi:MAG: PDZ domain-containing protein, partial [Bacteriovoracaceae bacterium]|nr:PDZ domain-containing protein [Bacteriovoracaceae bacterium]
MAKLKIVFSSLKKFKSTKYLVGLALVALLAVCPLWGKSNSRFSTLELFNKVLFIIEHQYYRPVDAEKLIDGAINGMVQTLDPHSTFLDEEQYSKLEEDTSGEFAGIGVEVASKDGMMVIMAVLDDTPAFKAQLHPGDKIIEINHESLLGLNLAQVMEKMRGPVKSKLILGVLRDGSSGILTFNLERELIKVKAVKSELIQEDYLYARLGQFQKEVGEELRSAITKAQK